MNKLSFLVLVLMLSFCGILSAQSNKKFILSGSLVDSITQAKVSRATVVLDREPGNSYFSGCAADDNGVFRIKGVPEGDYRIKFSFIGYKTKSMSLKVKGNDKIFDIGAVCLKPSSLLLNSVEVKAQKQMFEYYADKQVINMDKVPGNEGSVTDALKNTGAVDVDPSSNKISLRGNQGVNILIDGKPMPEAETLLSQMPAQSVEKVEIQTTPSSKDDPEGDAGIINIITKKSNIDNLSGSATMATSTMNVHYGTLMLNYRKNRLNFYVSGTGGTGRRDFDNSYEQTNYLSRSLHYQNSEGSSRMKGNMGNFSLGMDYDPDDKNTFSVSGSLFKFGFDQNSNNNNTLLNDQRAFNYSYLSRNGGNNRMNNYSLSAFYKRKFNDKGHELTADGYYSKNNFDNDNDLAQAFSYLTLFPRLQKSKNNSDNKTLILKTDYVNPTGTYGKIEAGYRLTMRDRGSDYNVLNYSYNQATWRDSLNYSNYFRYKENINAIYLTYSNKLMMMDYKLGLRSEAVYTEGNQIATSESFTKSYLSLFPSLTLSYPLTAQLKLNFNASRRVNRPQMDLINPFVKVNGINSISKGNPDLEPTYVNVYELSLNPLVKAYYNYSTGKFTSVTAVVNDSINLNTTFNLSKVKTYGVELTIPYYKSPNFPVKIPDFVNFFNINFSYFRLVQDGRYMTEDLSLKRYSWNCSAFLGLKFFFDTDLTAGIRYNPKVSDSKFVQYSNTYAYFSLTKSLIEKKLKMSLNFNDLLKSNQRRTETFGNTYYSNSVSTFRDSRGVFLSLTYIFNDFKNTKDHGAIDDGRDKPEGGLF